MNKPILFLAEDEEDTALLLKMIMEEEGYGEGYQYDHDAPDGFSGQNYFPDELKRRPQFYDPPERGFEREIRKRLDYWSGLRAKRGKR